MRSFVLAAFLAAAASAAGTAPSIALDMSTVSGSTLYKLASPIARSTNNAAGNIHATCASSSTQDYTIKCAAGPTQNSKTCTLPKARAYDHHDSEVSVQTRMYLVDKNGKAQDTAVKSINYAQRASYLIKYDAQDRANNCAQQQVVALILDDTTPPLLVPNLGIGSNQFVEAASNWKLGSGSVASDALEAGSKDLTSKISYSIQDIKTGVYLQRNKPFAVVKDSITTLTVTNYLVHLKVCYTAGVYGHNGQNNCANYFQTIRVRDTKAPWINVHGADPHTHECATQYTDASGTCRDALDTEKLGLKLQVRPTMVPAGPFVDMNTKVGNYKISYNCADGHANKAPTKFRVIQVRDTTKPYMKLIGQATITHKSGAGIANSEQGVVCLDTCTKTSALKQSVSWGAKPWVEMGLGDYVRTYSCSDASGNTASITRTFVNVDTTKPVITLQGKATDIEEASRDDTYTDMGATCKDAQYCGAKAGPCILNDRVKISGAVVNMRIPGTYVVKYNCADNAGNAAKAMSRTIVVKDTTCPTITLAKPLVQIIEAGFPYVDLGATGTDDLDGNIPYNPSGKYWSLSGDTVNTRDAFYHRSNCAQIRAADSKAATGYYFITTSKGRVGVKCVMAKNGKTFTFKAIDGMKSAVTPIVPYKNVDGECAKYGMKAATSIMWAKAHFPARYFPANAAAKTDEYVCEHPTAAVGSSVTAKFDQITRAEKGKFIIQYHLKDQAQNTECAKAFRTVIVRDTLPPVITLKLKNKLVQVSNFAQKAIEQPNKRSIKNPAGSSLKGGNPFLVGQNVNHGYHATNSAKNSPLYVGKFMAEEAQASSGNAWIMGAAASAVTGVALLGYSMKKSTAVSVPV